MIFSQNLSFFFVDSMLSIFLWAEIDDIRNNGEMAKEYKQIEHFLGKKFSETECSEMLRSLSSEAEYFKERDPIERMGNRNVEDPHRGDPTAGRKWKKVHGEESPIRQLVALGEIIYLVRCNLVHGSKNVEGDDKKIIEMTIKPLKMLLQKAIEVTRGEMLEKG